MRLPILNRAIFLQLFVIISLLMIIPSIVAFVEKDFFVGRTFLYSSFAGIFIYLLISIALSNIPKTQNNFEKLISFILSYLFLPIFMAMPVVLCRDYVRLFDGWLEMVSAFPLQVSMSPLSGHQMEVLFSYGWRWFPGSAVYFFGYVQ